MDAAESYGKIFPTQIDIENIFGLNRTEFFINGIVIVFLKESLTNFKYFPPKNTILKQQGFMVAACIDLILVCFYVSGFFVKLYLSLFYLNVKKGGI